MSDPTWGDVKAAALARICPNTPETQSYVNQATWPAGDHGHTDCWLIGGLLAEVERLTAERDDWQAKYHDAAQSCEANLSYIGRLEAQIRAVANQDGSCCCHAEVDG